MSLTPMDYTRIKGEVQKASAEELHQLHTMFELWLQHPFTKQVMDWFSNECLICESVELGDAPIEVREQHRARRMTLREFKVSGAGWQEIFKRSSEKIRERVFHELEAHQQAAKAVEGDGGGSGNPRGKNSAPQRTVDY